MQPLVFSRRALRKASFRAAKRGLRRGGEFLSILRAGFGAFWTRRGPAFAPTKYHTNNICGLFSTLHYIWCIMPSLHTNPQKMPPSPHLRIGGFFGMIRIRHKRSGALIALIIRYRTAFSRAGQSRNRRPFCLRSQYGHRLWSLSSFR